MASSLQADGAGVRQRLNAKSSSAATSAELTPKAGNVAPRGPPPAFTVYLKLAIFSLLMFILPLTTYFATVSRMGTAWAGGLAALSANVVLIGYIIAAFLEDGEAGGEDRDQVFKATQPTGTKKEGKNK